MKVACGICTQDKDHTECEIVEPTAEEKRDLLSRGIGADSKYYYCKPCWRVLSSEHASEFMANQLERQFRTAGVSKDLSKKLAEKYKARLDEMRENGSKTR